MGVESPEGFCLKDYLVKKYGSPRIFSYYVYFRERFKTSWPIEHVALSDVESILRDPIFKEALLYWYKSAIDFVRDAAAQYKSYAYQRGRDIILTSNNYFRLGTSNHDRTLHGRVVRGDKSNSSPALCDPPGCLQAGAGLCE
jgi:hypothetical protein